MKHAITVLVLAALLAIYGCSCTRASTVAGAHRYYDAFGNASIVETRTGRVLAVIYDNPDGSVEAYLPDPYFDLGYFVDIKHGVAAAEKAIVERRP